MRLSEKRSEGMINSFYDGNGRCLFISEGNHARKIAPFESTLPISYSWNNSENRLEVVSPTGRYLILGESFSVENICLESSLFVYGTKADKTIELSYPIFFYRVISRLKAQTLLLG